MLKKGPNIENVKMMNEYKIIEVGHFGISRVLQNGQVGTCPFRLWNTHAGHSDKNNFKGDGKWERQ